MPSAQFHVPVSGGAAGGEIRCHHHAEIAAPVHLLLQKPGDLRRQTLPEFKRHGERESFGRIVLDQLQHRLAAFPGQPFTFDQTDGAIGELPGPARKVVEYGQRIGRTGSCRRHLGWRRNKVAF